MRYYCTYFDRNYLVRALSLIDSLSRNETKDFVLYCVCMDEITRIILEKLNIKNIKLIPFHIIEEKDQELVQTQKDRTIAEYYWSSTAAIILNIIESNPEIDVLTYLDSDLFFFSSPDPLFEEFGEESVLIHKHRFDKHLESFEKENGTFNVGLVSIRNDDKGLTVLKWWRERCIEWCYQRYEDGKMGDQLYLNYWPGKFEGVHILGHKGGGVAPWNHLQYEISINNENLVTVDDSPLIFYHFQSFTFYGENIFIPARHHTYFITEDIIKTCFIPYIESLEKNTQRLKSVLPDFNFGFGESYTLMENDSFLIRNEIVKRLDRKNIPQKEVWLNNSWCLFASKQIIDKNDIKKIEAIQINEKPNFDEEIISEDQLLVKLFGTKIADSIENIFIVGAHHFQEYNVIKALFPKFKRICLFEPIPELYDNLKKLEATDSVIKVFPYAISDRNGTADFYLTDNDGASSSLLQFKKHEEIFPHVKQVKKIPVETKTLDSVVQENKLDFPDFLFLDVQGAEFRIISSLSDEIKSNLSAIYTEASKEELYKGAKNLDDLESELSSLFELIGFIPLASQYKTHGNSLFLNINLKSFSDDKRKINRRFGEIIDAEINLALEFYHDKMPDKTADKLGRILSLFPNNKKAIISAGELLIEMEEYDTSEMIFSDSLKLWPDDLQIMNNLAVIKILKNEIESARIYLNKILKIDPYNMEAVENLETLNNI